MTESSEYSGLPECVHAVLQAANRLHKVLFDTPFPEIDTDPANQEQLDKIIAGAVGWGQVVMHAYGSVNPNSGYRDGLLGLFPDHPKQFPHDLPSVERAGDLLGSPPEELRTTVANMSKHAAGPKARDTLGNERGGPLDNSLENWPRIRRIIHVRYQAGVAQSLLLVGWARARVTALSNALVPTIHEVEKTSRYNRIIEVRQAGASHTVTLTDNEASFLQKLAEHGVAETLRTTKKTLISKIPQLRVAIRSVTAGQTANHSNYSIDKELRAGISLEPN